MQKSLCGKFKKQVYSTKWSAHKPREYISRKKNNILFSMYIALRSQQPTKPVFWFPSFLFPAHFLYFASIYFSQIIGYYFVAGMWSMNVKYELEMLRKNVNDHPDHNTHAKKQHEKEQKANIVWSCGLVGSGITFATIALSWTLVDVKYSRLRLFLREKGRPYIRLKKVFYFEDQNLYLSDRSFSFLWLLVWWVLGLTYETSANM